MVGWIVNNKFERKQVLPWNFRGETEGNHEKPVRIASNPAEIRIDTF
jgi:hypothetical protein